MNEPVVLDASALLALLQKEPGSDIVEESLPLAIIGAVNLSEVVAKLIENGMPEEAVRTALAGLDLEIHPFDEPLAYRTGALRAATRRLGLSLGDRACLALGESLECAVLTTDRNWADLTLDLTVRVIR